MNGSLSDGALHVAELLREARLHEQAGRLERAMDCYTAVIADSAWTSAWGAQAVGLRRLALLHHQRNESEAALETCRTSCEVALRAGDPELAAEAMNALGGFELERGSFETASDTFRKALGLAGENADLKSRIERNLDTLAEVQAALGRAINDLRRSLDALQKAPDSETVTAA